ncbi:DUF6170 family protein [Thalassotalea atypica]|uniref:DUF6170 family protein n=1 Tax=Thalassotalea atypica TaxID=2054316 RepID=UPI0025730C43|nr:DUF6170 family protein [Thalassotalea atypica]
MIFSSNQIEELKDYSIKERQEILALAMQKLTVPQKLMLNLIKLGLLIPPFIYLARQDWGMLVLTVIISLVAYLLVMKPASLSFCKAHIKQALKQFSKSIE